MGGMTIMFVLLIIIGGLGFTSSKSAQTAIGILFILSTLVNMITTGPACYPIVAYVFLLRNDMPLLIQ